MCICFVSCFSIWSFLLLYFLGYCWSTTMYSSINFFTRVSSYFSSIVRTTSHKPSSRCKVNHCSKGVRVNYHALGTCRIRSVMANRKLVIYSKACFGSSYAKIYFISKFLLLFKDTSEVMVAWAINISIWFTKNIFLTSSILLSRYSCESATLAILFYIYCLSKSNIR